MNHLQIIYHSPFEGSLWGLLWDEGGAYAIFAECSLAARGGPLVYWLRYNDKTSFGICKEGQIKEQRLNFVIPGPPFFLNCGGGHGLKAYRMASDELNK